MKVFVEFLHGEIPLNKGVGFVDNRGKGIGSIGTPKWAEIFCPVFQKNGNFNTDSGNLVGRIYLDKKEFLAAVGKKRISRSMLNTPEADTVFKSALKGVVK